MNIKILIAAHKRCWMPTASLYLPLHVGAALSREALPFCSDATGDNISAKNARYCELTGIYWAWKNAPADYIGLAHYRRHFAGRRSLPLFTPQRERLLTRAEAEALLQDCDLLLPKKRRYFIENLYDHYAHTHTESHLLLTRQILQQRCPEYLPAFDRLKVRTGAHMFNMFIMRWSLFDAYCSWLFPILDELDARAASEGLSAFQLRFVGRISELLLDVWVEKNALPYRELPFVQLGKTNWPKKILAFLGAKFRNKKYRQSF